MFQLKLHNIYIIEIKYFKMQIDFSTIDGNVEFVHSQYSCMLTSQVSQLSFWCPTKLLIIVIILE